MKRRLNPRRQDLQAQQRASFLGLGRATRPRVTRRGLFEMLERREVMDATYHDLAAGNFSQDWTNAALITTNDDWSGVPSIIGYRGDALSNTTNVDPQTIVGVGTPVVDVNANQTNPNTFTTGGVTEFAIANPTIALAGSGTARGAHIVIHLNTTGRQNINISYLLRDLESATDNSVQPIALQYRIGTTGDFTNVPAGFIADASAGPSLTTDTPVSITLPSAVENQSQLEVRIITNDAGGNDEWIGIDDILVTSNPISGGSNAAPVLADGNFVVTTIDEDVTDAANTGMTVTALIASAGDPITDTDAGALEGIAVTGVDNTSGSWQYSLTGVAPWTAFGTPTAAAARLLPADGTARVRFVPNANFNGVINTGLTFRAWDRTTGTSGGTADTQTAGGTTAFSTATDAAALTVTSVNDAPTITPIANQNTASGVAVGPIAFTITDVDNDVATFVSPTNISGSSDSTTVVPNANIVFGGSGASRTVTVTPAAGQSGTAVITVTINDGGVGGTVTETFDVVVAAPVLNAPVVTLLGANATFTEDGAAAVVDAFLTVTDADSTNLTGATITITNLQNGASEILSYDVGATGISANYVAGVLTLSGTSSVANYQQVLRTITYANTSQNPSTTPRSISFVVTDGTNSSAVVNKSVNVVSVNDNPTSVTQLPPQTIQVGQTVNFVLNVTDPDDSLFELFVISNTNFTAAQANFVSSGLVASPEFSVTGVAPGVATITYQVRDDESGTGLASFGSFEVTVVPAAAAETEVAVSGNQLVISDIGNASDDNLTLSIDSSVNPPVFVIADPTNTLTTTIAGATGNGTNELRIPLNSQDLGLVQGLSVETGAGNDTLALDFSNGAFALLGNGYSVDFVGGTGSDELQLLGGVWDTNQYDYDIATGPTDGFAGTITLTDVLVSSLTVNFEGLEPILNTGTVTDVIFNLPAVANGVFLEDNGIAADNISRLRSDGTFELTDFTNPTGSLTVNMTGAFSDTVILSGFDVASAIPVVNVNTSDGDDTVSVLATAAATDTNISTGNGISDLVVIGRVSSAAAGTGSLANILGDINTLDPNNMDLTVDNGADAANRDWLISSPGVAQGRIATTGLGLISYDTGSTNTLSLQTGTGSDEFTFDFTGGNPTDPLPFAGFNISAGAGAGSDSIVLQGSPTFGTVTHSFTNDNDGNIAIEGADINYIGLEPIIDNLDVNNRIFNFTQEVTNGELTRVSGTHTRLESSVNEQVDFTTPNNSLTINGSVTAGAFVLEVLDLADDYNTATNTINPNSTGFSSTTFETTGDAASNWIVNGANNFQNVVTVSRAAGTLDNIQGSITFFGGTGNADVLFVLDYSDTDDNTYTLDETPGGDFTIARTAAGLITYDLAVEVVQLDAGRGNDTINVNATSGEAFTEVEGGLGDDSFGVNASRLGEGGTDGTVELIGNDDDDTFDIFITTLAVISAPLSIDGGANNFAIDGSRDTVNVNDVVGLGALVATATYGAGSDFTLSGALLVNDLNVTQAETIRYFGGGGGDQITVVGTAASDDLITAVPLNSFTTLVFNNSPADASGPFNGPPEDFTTRIPGVSGGSVRPDLYLTGLDSTTGLTISDPGPGTGDRLYVYGQSEVEVNDTLAFDPFGFGAGVIVPAVTVGTAYDTIVVDDTSVSVNNFVVVNYNNTDFVQADPLTQASVVVNSGFEGNVVGTADDIAVTLSPNYRFTINGGDPDPTTTGIVPPNGDQLTFNAPFVNVVNVWATKPTDGSQPIITIDFDFANTGLIPISYSSIENLGPIFASTVNLIGDNNDPLVDQNDTFIVSGVDTDGFAGDGAYQEFELFINGAVVPLRFDGVRDLNVQGYDAQSGGVDNPVGGDDENFDTLEITAFADNAGLFDDDAPTGWGIDVFFDEGEPNGTDGVQDLIVYHTSLGLGGGGSVSEDIVVVPSGPDNGEIRVTNQTDGSVIVVIQYIANTDLIFLDDDGSLSDSDTLTLQGTVPVTAQTSGDDDFEIDMQAAGDVANPWITVTDADSNLILYRVRNFVGFPTISIDTLAGDDAVLVNNNATQRIEVSLGEGDDLFNGDLNGTGTSLSLNAPVYGGSGNDILLGTSEADVLHGEGGFDSINGGDGADTLYGGDDIDTFTVIAGEGLDFISGGSGSTDQVVYNSSVAEVASLRSISGTGVVLTVGGNQVFGASDIESVRLVYSGQVTLTLEDLEQSSVVDVQVRLNSAAVDSLTVNGSQVSDQISVVPGADGLFVDGLPYDLNISTAQPTDTLTILGLGGNDNLIATEAAAALMTLTFDGGAGDDYLSANATLIGGDGNDTLIGGSGNNILIGGAGNDLIRGGAGDDTIDGGDGDDTIVGGTGADTIDGGADFDTILVEGTSANDRISVQQDTPTQIQYEVSNQFTPGVDGVIGGVGTEVDILSSGSVEEIKVLAGAGDDQILVRQADGLISTNSQALSLRVTVDGGSPGASDRLTIVDDGAGDTVIQRISATPGSGSYTIGALAPIFYDGIEYTSMSQIDPITGGTGTDGLGNGRLYVFKADTYEQNNTLPNATFLGSGASINIDPVIDPGPDAVFGVGGDEDWYRLVAEQTGTLDIRVFFRLQPTLANGRLGLPGNGNLDIAVYDLDGTDITSTFRVVGAAGDERVRIPAVEGQTYYLRVRASTANPDAVNVYNINVVNDAPPVAYGLELNDLVASGTIVNSISAVSFIGPASLSTVDDFYNGKWVYITAGARAGERALVTDYVGATRTFTLAAGTSGLTGAPGLVAFQIESFDTGRSQLDNLTRDTTPTIVFRLDDGIFLNDVQGNGVAGNPPVGAVAIPFRTGPVVAGQAGYAIAIFDEGASPNGSGTAPQTPIGYATQISPGLYEFTPTVALAEGSHFLSARVEMRGSDTPQQIAYGDRSSLLEIVVDSTAPLVDFGLYNVLGDGLVADSDSGVIGDQTTNDTTPSFFGRAESDAIVRLYVDSNGNGVFDNTDLQIGQTVAQPFDGTNQFPNGQWEITSLYDLNNIGLPPDGLRTLFVTAEDPSGNVSGLNGAVTLQILIDTVGPQILDVDVNTFNDPLIPADDNPYDLFDPKGDPRPDPDGPTPLVESLVVTIRDLPATPVGFLDNHFIEALIENPGHYLVTGDYNGIIPISEIIFTFDGDISTPAIDPIVAGAVQGGYIEIVFVSPLPDDRFTLEISDAITDAAGNALDGESNADEPQEPVPPTTIRGVDGVPSGDNISGGEFVARFNVDTRPEVGTWAAGSVWVDNNGNESFDPNNPDFSNRDIAYVIGFTTDEIFAGNFANVGGVTDNFDKLAAYGRVNGQYRWLIDTDNDGVPNIIKNDAMNISGYPVAGNFNLDTTDGDEVAVFDGTRWHLDTTGDYQLDSTLPGTSMRGLPVVGDFDDDGIDDLGTWTNDTFYLDLSTIGGITGNFDTTFVFGFIGANERPIAGDVNADGIDDLGLFVPKRAGVPDQETAEWYFLVSGNVQNDDNNGAALLGPTLPERIVTDPVTGNPVIRFQPEPFGNDVYVRYGDEFALPVFGNFDPPLTTLPAVLDHNTRDPLDVNNSGGITPFDALLIINQLNLNTSGTPIIAEFSAFNSAPFYDVSADGQITPFDALLVINWLNQNPGAGSINSSVGEGEGEGEPADAIFASYGEDDNDELYGLLALETSGSGKKK